MTDKKSNFTVFMVRRLPPGIFGETYLIVTGTEASPSNYRAEHFILTQRPTERLHIGTVATFGQSFPPELGTVDIDFAISEAYRQAELDFGLLLEKRATELNRGKGVRALFCEFR